MESSTRTALDLDLLLAQTDWVQRLARRLVADEERARDVAQDVFLTALERPPERAANEKSLRAWLARVVRSMVHVGSRSDARRRLRESSVARPPQSDSAAETVARAAQLQLVVDTVMELEEPYRSALLMTYFDGLSAAEAGARLGASEVAIRKRVSRGLQRLREKLDRLHGGDRTAWVSAFAPWLTWHEPAVPAAGAGALGIGTKIAAALLAAGVGSFVLEAVWLPDVEVAGPQVARIAGLGSTARTPLAPPAERFAPIESARSFGWLQVAAEDGSEVAWSLATGGRTVGDVRPIHAAAAVLRVPVDRALALVGVADGGRRRVVELAPFAPGEVRDLIVRFDAPEPVSDVAVAPPVEPELRSGHADSDDESERVALRRARHVSRASDLDEPRRSGSSAGTPRRGPDSARATGVEDEPSDVVETWGLRIGSSTIARGDGESPYYATQGYALGAGLSWTLPSGDPGTSGPNVLGNAYGYGGLQSMTAGTAGSTGTSTGTRIVAVDAATGWPTWASALSLPLADGALVLAATADGRMGFARRTSAGAPAAVFVRPAATLFVEPPAGTGFVAVDLAGVEVLRVASDELEHGLRLPGGDVRVRFLSSAGRTFSERSLALVAGASSTLR